MSGDIKPAASQVQYGPKGTRGADGLTPRQLSRIDEALTLSSHETGLTFSVYIGELADPARATAERLFEQLVTLVDNGVLVAVSPAQRVLHIVTGESSAMRLPNRACALAALGMRGSFANGDLAGGIVTGLRMLADSAGRP
ncbi:MAG TPA: DUF5130 family protein [Jatrophihabitantaceae bacterium]|nr:DUF5130 family protein [Jatrophihabitantaceae bacterium]